MSTILLLLALQTDVAAELAAINQRLAVIEAQLGIGGGGARLEIVGVFMPAVDVRWVSITNPAPLDWLGIYQPGAGNGAHRAWVYTSSCTTSGGSAAPSTGHCLLNIGSLAAGTYEARYFRNDAFALVTKSPTFTITASEAADVYGPASAGEVCYSAQAPETVDLAWDVADTGPVPDGYELLVGAQSQTYTDRVDVGNTLWSTYPFFGNEMRCFRVRAYLR